MLLKRTLQLLEIGRPILSIAAQALLLGLLIVAPGRAAEPAEQGTRHIHVVSNGWHSGIALRVADLPRDGWAVARDFPRADYLLISWGDRAFYQAKKVTLKMLLGALFVPTPSTIHVVPVQGSLLRAFPHSDIVRITLSPANFRRLEQRLGRAFVTNEEGRPERLGPGFYPASRFYASRGAYYFPKTCNVWTARELRSGAGCKVAPPCALTADDLIWQVKKVGVYLQRKSHPRDAF